MTGDSRLRATTSQGTQEPVVELLLISVHEGLELVDSFQKGSAGKLHGSGKLDRELGAQRHHINQFAGAGFALAASDCRKGRGLVI